jgi:hypothetical protein
MFMDKVTTSRVAPEEVWTRSRLLDERPGSPHPVPAVLVYLRT